MKNTIAKRIMIFILCIIFAGAVIFIAFWALKNSNSLYYEMDNIDVYSDTILYDYDDYKDFVKYYQIQDDLIKEDFKDNSYIASFQEYDKCSENKVKKVEDIKISKNNINIKYKVFNKCGWCRSKMLVYLIKTDKLSEKNYEITYDYNYQKKLNCGIIN